MGALFLVQRCRFVAVKFRVSISSIARRLIVLVASTMLRRAQWLHIRTDPGSLSSVSIAAILRQCGVAPSGVARGLHLAAGYHESDLLQVVLQVEVVSLQGTAAGGGGDDGLAGGHAVGSLVFFALVAVGRGVERSVVVLDR